MMVALISYLTLSSTPFVLRVPSTVRMLVRRAWRTSLARAASDVAARGLGTAAASTPVPTPRVTKLLIDGKVCCEKMSRANTFRPALEV